VVEEVREVASGLNDKRPKLTRILKVLAEGGADIILAEYRDRLTRFGFNYLSFFAQSHGARIETVFDDVKKDAMQELIEDMISVVQSFSARLYGRRSHKYKRIVEGVKAAAYSAG
jgi:putative resolvase